jgi:hypothetical protein
MFTNRYDWYVRKLSAEDDVYALLDDFILHPKKAKYKHFPYTFEEYIKPMVQIAKRAIKECPEYFKKFQFEFRAVKDFIPELSEI